MCQAVLDILGSSKLIITLSSQKSFDNYLDMQMYTTEEW